MAQRVNVVLVDDIDGSDAVETVGFGLDGVSYDIDLSDVHAKELREALAPFVDYARRVGGRKVSRKRDASAAPAAAAANGTGPTPAEIRAWAEENGYEVTSRGRIPAALREAYDEANA